MVIAEERTPETTIETLTNSEFQGNASLVENCRCLLAEFYRDPDVPLQYATAHESTHVYVRRPMRNASPTGFFFAQMPETICASLPLVVYMGLVVVRRSLAEKGTARRLVTTFLREVRETVGPDTDVLAWYRTATPFGLFPARALLRDGFPSEEGAVSDRALAALRELRLARGIPESLPSDHPFVVRGYAQARFNEAETEFIAAYRQSRGQDLLQRLSVNESRGDRLLMFGYVP